MPLMMGGRTMGMTNPVALQQNKQQQQPSSVFSTNPFILQQQKAMSAQQAPQSALTPPPGTPTGEAAAPAPQGQQSFADILMQGLQSNDPRQQILRQMFSGGTLTGGGGGMGGGLTGLAGIIARLMNPQIYNALQGGATRSASQGMG